MELQVGVKILLKNLDEKYLLLRRDPSKYPEVGAQWDLVGGRIEAGVTLLENLRREIVEETGLAPVGEPKLLAAQDILRRAEKHIVRLTYGGNASGELVLSPEHSAYQWFTMDELKSLDPSELDPYFRELLEASDDVFQGTQYYFEMIAKENAQK